MTTTPENVPTATAPESTKPESTKPESTKPESTKKDSFGDLVRKVALASVGGVVLLQEEVEEFVSKLVQKGELAEKDGKSLVKDLLEKRKQTREVPAAVAAAAAAAASAATTAFAPAASVLPIGASAITSAIDSTVDRVLHRINVPTKADVEELAKKIDEIDKKLEALASGAAAKPGSVVLPR